MDVKPSPQLFGDPEPFRRKLIDGLPVSTKKKLTKGHHRAIDHYLKTGDHKFLPAHLKHIREALMRAKKP